MLIQMGGRGVAGRGGGVLEEGVEGRGDRATGQSRLSNSNRVERA
jgi:hypothetical protein